MSSGKCNIVECVAPVSCHNFVEDHTKCDHWIKGNVETLTKKELKKSSGKMVGLGWSGEPIIFDSLSKIVGRTNPIIIGAIGRAKAGKTTFLAMIYTLLLNGKKLNDFKFAGSKTILGWDKLYAKLKIQKEQVSFPDATLPEYFRLYHLALRDLDDNLKDLFLTEASGEVFYNWSQNRNHADAENARLIYEISNAFVFFIDCKDLVDRKGAAKNDIIDIAQMINHDLKNRPLIVVWSKADEKSNIHPSILSSLQAELQTQFGDNLFQLEISNFPVDNPDHLVHENNLKVISWAMNEVLCSSTINLKITSSITDDLFLNYRGK